MPDTTMNPALSGGNPYDATSAPAPALAAPPQQANPFGIFGGGGDPNATGGLGMSMGTGNGLMNFGANMAMSAGARTSDGHLANPGFLGALAGGLQQTLAQGRQAGVTQAELASKNAATIGQQLKNRLDQLQFPTEQARQAYMAKYWQQIQNGQPTPVPTAADTATTSSASPPTGPQTITGGGSDITKNDTVARYVGPQQWRAATVG